MYFATAQALPEKKSFGTGLFNDVPGARIPGIDFEAMWAVPVTTFKETMAAMLCTAPNYPMFFAIVESDDYIRVDKIKHYRNIMTGAWKTDPLPPAADDFPEHKVEYLLNKSTLRPFPVLGGMTNSVDQIENPHDLKMSAAAFSPGIRFNSLFVDLVQGCVADIPRVNMASDSIFDGMNNREARTYWNREWYLYRYVIMPVILWALCEDTRAENIEEIRFNSIALEACRGNINDLMIADRNYALWSRNDCSIEGFETTYGRVRDLTIDNPIVLENLAHRIRFGRNDICPCGSELKVRKCHPVLS